MAGNARPDRAGSAMDYLHGESITTLPWSVINLNLNPIQYIYVSMTLYAKRTHLLEALDGSNNQVHQELMEELTSTTNQKISE